MENPFKTGDKVLTKVKGQPVEAVVHQVYNQEVQVRTANKILLWRTVKTVTLVTAATVPPVEEPEKPVAIAPETPEPMTPPPLAASDNGSGVKPPPLPSVKYTEPAVETPKNGPALTSVKYERTRPHKVKRKKI